jgi:hypothetical protein
LVTGEPNSSPTSQVSSAEEECFGLVDATFADGEPIDLDR